MWRRRSGLESESGGAKLGGGLECLQWRHHFITTVPDRFNVPSVIQITSGGFMGGPVGPWPPQILTSVSLSCAGCSDMVM